MNKNNDKLKKLWGWLLILMPIFFILIISLLPVYYSWGRLLIGGDNILPFDSQGIKKYLFQWVSVNNGEYYMQNYFPHYLIYYFAESIHLSIYQISSVILFSFNFLAGLAIYKLVNLIYEPKKKYYLLFPIIFYLFSPALLNGWHYLFIYTFSPWFVYLVVKIIKRREVTIPDILFLNIILFFSSVDLPNPKYLFHLFLIGLFLFCGSIVLKLISPRSVIKNYKKIIFFLISFSFILIPLVNFGINYSPERYNVHIKLNYQDSGKMMDAGVAKINKMFQLHHDNVNLNAVEKNVYDKNKLSIAFNSTLIFFIILVFWRRRKDDETSKIELIFLTLIIVYLAMAIGPNPPTGFIYEFLVSRVTVLAFLRTTAGAVFFVSIFYSVLLFAFLNRFRKIKLILFLSLSIAIILANYPFLNGIFYKNLNPVGNKTINQEEYGIKIPEQYFNSQTYVNSFKIDGKLLHFRSDLSYINTNWGFFGPSVYSFLYNRSNIAYNKIFSTASKHNVLLGLADSSLKINSMFVEPDRSAFTSDKKYDFLQFFIIKPENFLPHLYTAKQTTIFKDSAKYENTFPPSIQLDDAFFYSDQNKNKSIGQLPVKISNPPTIEYKKINSTKYRIIVHHAHENFPLVFSENFDPNWKILGTKRTTNTNKDNLVNQISKYIVFPGNEAFQANKEELLGYINQDLISSLGNNKEKEQNYYEWSNGRKDLSGRFNYDVDFVSKNFSGTIQNDNLTDGNIFETLLSKPVAQEENHYVTNGYANSWLIKTKEYCSNNISCQSNSDGSYDFELVLEFAPQKILYISLVISFLSIIAGLLYYLLKKRIKIKKPW